MCFPKPCSDWKKKAPVAMADSPLECAFSEVSIGVTKAEQFGGPLATLRIPVGPSFPSHPLLVKKNFADQHRFLSDSKLFANLGSSEMEDLASLARVRYFERDQALYTAGQRTHEVSLIRSGTVKLTQLGDSGNEVIVKLSGRSDAVGVVGIASPGIHTNCARAVLRCTVLTWNCDKIVNMPQVGGKIRHNVNLILQDQLIELQERFVEVATEKVDRRVALALLRIARSNSDDLSVPVEVFLSREEIAQLTGTTLFAISRLVSKWHDLGICLPRREALVIVRPDLLAQAAANDNRIV